MNKTRRLFNQVIREMFFILKLAHLVFRMSHLRMISSLNDAKETRKTAFWRSLRKKTPAFWRSLRGLNALRSIWDRTGV